MMGDNEPLQGRDQMGAGKGLDCLFWAVLCEANGASVACPSVRGVGDEDGAPDALLPRGSH